jgi:hypothetical protein
MGIEDREAGGTSQVDFESGRRRERSSFLISTTRRRPVGSCSLVQHEFVLLVSIRVLEAVTIDSTTLQSGRKQAPEASLNLMMGKDSFPGWTQRRSTHHGSGSLGPSGGYLRHVGQVAGNVCRRRLSRRGMCDQHGQHLLLFGRGVLGACYGFRSKGRPGVSPARPERDWGGERFPPKERVVRQASKAPGRRRANRPTSGTNFQSRGSAGAANCSRTARIHRERCSVGSAALWIRP